MFKIKRVVLENFCQHEYLDIPFSDGLTVVLGPNGSGKSNFLSAIYGAFTGRFDRGAGEITEHIRKNQDGNCSVQVIGTVADDEFHLRRSLSMTSDGKGKVGHALWQGSEKRQVCKTASEIEAWITQSSGLTSDLMSEFLFIGQEDLYGFWKRNDASRTKMFMALCGTKSYENIRENYAQLVKADRTHYETVTITVDLVQKTLDTARANLAFLEAELKAAHLESGKPGFRENLETHLQNAREALRKQEEMETVLDRYAGDMESVLARLTRAQQEDQDQEKNLGVLGQEIKKQGRETDRLERELLRRLAGSSWEETIFTLNRSLQSNAKRESLENRIAQAQSRLAAIPDLPAFDDRKYLQVEAERATLIARLGELESNLHSIRTMIDLLRRFSDTQGVKNDCPLCGADTKNWKVDLKALKRMEREQSAQQQTGLRRRDELDRALADGQARREQTQRHRHNRAELLRWLQEFQRELAACPAFDPEAETKLAALTAQEKELHNARQTHQTLLARFHRETELLKRWQAQHRSCQEEFDRLQREVKALGAASPEVRRKQLAKLRHEITRLEEQLADARQRENRIATLQGARSEALRQVEKHHTELDGHRRFRDSFGNAELWYQKCDRVIDWFRKDGLPRLVHRSVLNDLVAAINGELAMFADPFRVRVNEDVTFTAIFEERGASKEILSKALSGGEKYMLGLAFLSAVNRTFASNLGVMFIDEPTASLDTRHIGLLFRILYQWKTVLRKQGRQLIIVTHVEDMAQIADTVIRFDHGGCVRKP